MHFFYDNYRFTIELQMRDSLLECLHLVIQVKSTDLKESSELDGAFVCWGSKPSFCITTICDTLRCRKENEKI